MVQCMRFDNQDRAALRALDDFTITSNGEIAKVVGEMEVTVVRPAHDGGDQFWLTIKFASDETLDVRIRRAQLLEQLDIEADDS
jgi:hypothetical protein